MTSSSDIAFGAYHRGRRAPKHHIVVPKLRAWHHSLGAALGILVLITALTGSILVYKDAIVRHTIAAGVPEVVNYQPPTMARELDGIVARYPTETIAYLKPPAPERPYWTLVEEGGGLRLVAVDSLTELTAFPWLLDALAVIRQLHVDLMLHLKGEVIMLLLGLVMLFFTLTGLIMWWPSRRHFKPSHLIPRRLTRQQLLISHRQLGVLLAPMLFLAALTGSVMMINGFVYMATAPNPSTGAAEDITQDLRSQARLPASELLLAATHALPEGTITLIHLADATSASAVFRMRLPGEWHPNGRTKVRVAASSGEVADFVRADQASPGRRLLNQMYPLHSAYGLSGFFRLLVFIGGGVTVWLSFSGMTGWLKKRRKARRHS